MATIDKYTINNLIDGTTTIDDLLTERFFDRSSPDTGLAGGSGGVSQGSPLDSTQPPGGGGVKAKGVVKVSDRPGGHCPDCGGSLQNSPDGTNYCSNCGTHQSEGQETPGTASTAHQGGDGVYSTGRPGYLHVPGGPISTSEMAGKLRLKYLGGLMFEMEFKGTKLEHSLTCAHTVMSHRLRQLGYNQNRLMPTLIEWLFKAKANEEIVWDLANNTRMVMDSSGFKEHMDGYNEM